MTQTETASEALFQPMIWQQDHLQLLDQRLLPHQEHWLRLEHADQAATAIRDLAVRGAPAIGITAAYGAVLAACECRQQDKAGWREEWITQLGKLAQARPTAVNLGWALDRMLSIELPEDDPLARLEQEAIAIHQEDINCNRQLAALGSGLIRPGSRVLTHCNTGPLATGGIGTALGVIISAWQQGRLTDVFADETRPWLQGSRLTAWELTRHQVPCQLIIDGAAAWLMASQGIDWLIVGADRVAANGDVANKIGTYSAMLAARSHGVNTMVVVPWSTVDMNTTDGGNIPIEQRADSEITNIGGHQIAAEGATSWNPVFDITPAELVDFLVTERGIIANPDQAKIAELA